MIGAVKMTLNSSRLKKKITSGVIKFVKLLILMGICFVVLYPQFEKVAVSFMSVDDLYDSSVQYIPSDFSFNNYKTAIEYTNYWRTVLRTVLFVTANSLLQVSSAMLIGYGFARFDFKGKKLLFGCVIATLIIPIQSFIVPLYKYFLNFNLFNTPLPILLLSIGGIGLKSGLYIFMFRQRFAAIPKELDESGKIDGAGTFKIFTSIMLPSATTVTVTCFLFSFVWQWTDNYYISVFMPSNQYLSNMVSAIATRSTDVYLLSILTNTGTVLLVLPILLLFLVAQRFFVQGVETAGIVG